MNQSPPPSEDFDPLNDFYDVLTWDLGISFDDDHIRPPDVADDTPLSFNGFSFDTHDNSDEQTIFDLPPDRGRLIKDHSDLIDQASRSLEGFDWSFIERSDGSSLFDFADANVLDDPELELDLHNPPASVDSAALSAESSASSSLKESPPSSPQGVSCNRCNISVASLASLRKHNEADHARSRHCLHEGCPWSFRHAKDLRRHVASKHNKKRDWHCPQESCPYHRTGFTRFDSYLKHMRRKHSIGGQAEGSVGSSTVCKDRGNGHHV